MTHIADRFARIEAEYKAIKKLYEASKAEALEACMAAAGDDLKAYVADRQDQARMGNLWQHRQLHCRPL